MKKNGGSTRHAAQPDCTPCRVSAIVSGQRRAAGGGDHAPRARCRRRAARRARRRRSATENDWPSPVVPNGATPSTPARAADARAPRSARGRRHRRGRAASASRTRGRGQGDLRSSASELRGHRGRLRETWITPDANSVRRHRRFSADAMSPASPSASADDVAAATADRQMTARASVDIDGPRRASAVRRSATCSRRSATTRPSRWSATPSRRGVRYFDTAPHYGNGLSEHRIGAALRACPARRLRAVDQGRTPADPRSAARRATSTATSTSCPSCSAGTIRATATLRSIDDSLQRLGLARVDFVFIHDVARDAHGDAQPQRFREAMDGAVPALARLKAEGAIAGYGLGVNDWRVCVDALAHADLDVLLLAGRYTLLDQTALPELLPLCEKRGTRIVVGGPFNSGILATGTRPAGRPHRVLRLCAGAARRSSRARPRSRTLCAAHGVPLKAAALQFPRAHPAVACVVAGARIDRRARREPRARRVTRFRRRSGANCARGAWSPTGAPLPGDAIR